MDNTEYYTCTYRKHLPDGKLGSMKDGYIGDIGKSRATALLRRDYMGIGTDGYNLILCVIDNTKL